MGRTFYRNTITVVVLSAGEPISDEMSLARIEEEYTEGQYNHCKSTLRSEEIDGATAAKELMDSGSSPAFFGLLEDGSCDEGGLYDCGDPECAVCGHPIHFAVRSDMPCGVSVHMEECILQHVPHCPICAAVSARQIRDCEE